MRNLCGLLLLILNVWQPVFADDSLAVITNINNPLQTLSLDDLKLIYLRKKFIDDNSNLLLPLNLPISDPLRRTFAMALFSVLPEQQEEFWNIQYFNGIVPPKVMASEEAVLRFISITEGAIGYVRKQKLDKRVKVLLLITPATK